MSSLGFWMTPNWGGAPDTLEGKAVIYKDLDRLKGWACRNLMKLDKEQRQSRTPWVDQPLAGHRLGTA